MWAEDCDRCWASWMLCWTYRSCALLCLYQGAVALSHRGWPFTPLLLSLLSRQPQQLQASCVLPWPNPWAISLAGLSPFGQLLSTLPVASHLSSSDFLLQAHSVPFLL